MNWSGSAETAPLTRIAALWTTLNASERRVADALRSDPAAAVETTAQNLAEKIGVARSTVIRACQSLGYAGYPQLRVALAREQAVTAPVDTDHGEGTLGRIRSAIDEVARALPVTTSLLSEDQVDGAVDALAAARRVIVVGAGFASPLAAEVSARLTLVGRPVEHVADPAVQAVVAAGLTDADVAVIIDYDGAVGAAAELAAVAARAGATVIAFVGAPGSALEAHSDLALVVPSAGGQASRVGFGVLLELVALAVGQRCPSATLSTTTKAAPGLSGAALV